MFLCSGTLTALHRDGRGLQPRRPAAGLRHVHPEDEPHPRVLPPDVGFSSLELDVGVPQLQDAGAVEAVEKKQKERKERLFDSRITNLPKQKYVDCCCY